MQIPPPTGGEPTQTGPNQFAQMDSEEFVKVLFTELQNQDPMDPQDSSKLLEQLSSIRNIESQMSLQDSLEELVMQNQVASAGNLIGKTVRGLDDMNNRVEGLVSSVRVTEDAIMLELDTGETLSLDRVSDIAEAPAGTSAGAAE